LEEEGDDIGVMAGEARPVNGEASGEAVAGVEDVLGVVGVAGHDIEQAVAADALASSPGEQVRSAKDVVVSSSGSGALVSVLRECWVSHMSPPLSPERRAHDLAKANGLARCSVAAGEYAGAKAKTVRA
jgi:hypothetical protein